MQRLSLFSCAVTFATSPIILIFDTSATGLGAKASIAATLCTFGIFTTGACTSVSLSAIHKSCAGWFTFSLALETAKL
jgi:hypothetical protein